MDHPRRSRQTSFHPTARLFVRLKFLTSSYVAADPTTDAKIRTCHFDDENERCRSLKVVQWSRNLPVIMPRHTTILIMRDISKADRFISKNVKLFAQSGFKSVLDRFVWSWCFELEFVWQHPSKTSVVLPKLQWCHLYLLLVLQKYAVKKILKC